MPSPKEVMMQQYEDFNNRTYRQTAASYVSPDAVFVDGPTGQETYGIEGFIQFNDMWATAFSDARTELISIEEDGNMCYSTFIGRGTFDGQMPAPDGSMIPGNGSLLEMEFSSETEVVDGMIVHDVTNYDMAMMMAQLGLG